MQFKLNLVKKSKDVNNYPFWLLFAFTLAFMIMVARNMFINNFVVTGDETLYKTLAKDFFDQSPAAVRFLPPLSNIPTPLYLRIFYFAHYFQENFYEAAKILNSLFFCLAVFPIYGVARIFVQPRVALLIGVCALISPFGAHTAYFMPESMYYFLFWVFAYSFLKLVGPRMEIAGLAAGVTLSLLFLTKPHALAQLIAVNLVFITFFFMRTRLSLSVATLVRALIVLNLSFWLIMLPLKYLLLGENSSLSLLGLYSPYGNSIADISSLPSTILQLFFVVTGHISLLSIFYFLPLTVIVFLLVTIDRDDPLRIQYTGLCLLALFAFLIPLAMTIRFSVEKTDEILRIHGRYYNFMFPLFITGFFVGFDRVRSLKRPGALYFSVANLIGAIFLVFALIFLLQGRQPPVFDFPDMSWWVPANSAYVSLPIIVAVSAAVLLYYSFARSPRIEVFVIFFISFTLLGSILVFKGQSNDSRVRAEWSRPAIAVESLLEPSELNSGIIFTSQTHTAYYFQFYFNGLPFVKIVPPGSTIEPKDIPAEAAWAVLLDYYNFKVPYVSSIQGYNFWFGRLKSGTPHITEAREGGVIFPYYNNAEVKIAALPEFQLLPMVDMQDLAPSGPEGTTFVATGLEPAGRFSVDLPASKISSLRIQLQISPLSEDVSSVHHQGSLYFRRTNQADFVPQQRLDFTVLADSKLHTYYLDPQNTPGWRDKIAEVRVVPIRGLTSTSQALFQGSFLEVAVGAGFPAGVCPPFDYLYQWAAADIDFLPLASNEISIDEIGMRGQLSGPHPVLFRSLEDRPLPAEAVDTMVIAIQSQSLIEPDKLPVPVTGSFYFRPMDQNFDEVHSFKFNWIPDNQPQEVRINLQSNPHWQGLITGLRLDPVLNPDQVTSSFQFTLGRVQFLAENAPVCP